MAIRKRPVSPRQKMINLMYVVLMAMLALNVSNEVLNGFAIVQESLNRTTENAAQENLAIYQDFEEQMAANPQKVKEWYEKAMQVKEMSESLYGLAAELKLAIAQEADGKKANPDSLQNKEDLEAANQIMLAPGRGRGEELKKAIETYRDGILNMVTDSIKKQHIASDLTTNVPSGILGKNWQEYMFEAMPAVAAVTMLTKLQNDVRNAEKEVLHTLVQNIDVKDIRVNALDAFVIPNSQTIVQGDRFSAHIVMAAIDTTQVPELYIGGKKMDLPGNIYETVCSRTGDFTLSGYIQTINGNGDPIRRDFEQKYTVVEPSATVSADLTRMLYKGYPNPISVSVPGVPLNKIQATMTNGTLTASGPGKYIANPSVIGQEAVITVTSTNTGRPQTMGSFSFKVRKLPDPTPYIDIKDEQGNPSRFKGGNMYKASLVGAESIGAAIDDGILDIGFRVISFQTVFFDNMGNAKPINSEGARFSAAQKDQIRKLSRGRRFYISGVTAVGPDGIERTLSAAMEIKVQ